MKGMMMKYKMIAVDMDGTLLNSKHEITARTKAAMVAAVEAGVIYVTATGRAVRGVGLVNSLFEKDLPFMVYNGASVVMGKTGKVLFNKFLDKHLAKEVFDTAKSRDIPVVMWTDKGLRTSREDEDIIRYSKVYSSGYQLIDSVDEINDENIYKLFWIAAAEENMKNQVEMREHFGEKLNCFTSVPTILEFVSSEAGKGIALEELGRVYGIDRSEMIAVGDGFNDISMLDYAGLGVAMENAPDAVKAVCRHITASNDDDGVAAVIEKFILS